MLLPILLKNNFLQSFLVQTNNYLKLQINVILKLDQLPLQMILIGLNKDMSPQLKIKVNAEVVGRLQL